MQVFLVRLPSFLGIMSKLLSLLLVILFTLDVTLVAARPKALSNRSVLLTPVDISHLNTNAKRFAAGHPPLPPLFKRKPTKVASTSTLTRKAQIMIVFGPQPRSDN